MERGGVTKKKILLEKAKIKKDRRFGMGIVDTDCGGVTPEKGY